MDKLQRVISFAPTRLLRDAAAARVAASPGLSRIDPRPIRRQAPTGGPLAKALDLVARSDSHGYDILRSLNQRHVQERRQPAARLDLGSGPVGVVWAGLFHVQPVVPRVDAPDRVLLVTPGCERRLKSAARGGRKVQRWGWLESTPG